MKKYTLNQAIETMNEIASNPSPLKASLFTAQDVLNILQSIELPEVKTERAHIPDAWVDNFIDHITSNLDESEIVDRDSIQFSIRYNNEIYIDDAGIDSYHLRNQLTQNLHSAIKGVNDEIDYEYERKEEVKTWDENTTPQNDSNN